MSIDTLTRACGPRLADDTDPVLASKAGDSTAFEQLVARYDRKLFRIAYHIVHSSEDAQDMVQEAFIKAFENLNQFRADSKFSTWLYRIVVNQSLMALRKKRHQPAAVGVSFDNSEEGESQLPMDFSDWRPNPEEEYKAAELRQLLIRFLMELRPAQRVVFVMHDIEGQTLRDTADVLGLTLAAVKTRSLRARLFLREQLSTYFSKDVAKRSDQVLSQRPATGSRDEARAAFA